MKPMYLPQVEDPAGARGAYTSILEAMAAGGGPVSQIWYMFAFKPQATDHLLRFTRRGSDAEGEVRLSIQTAHQGF